MFFFKYLITSVDIFTSSEESMRDLRCADQKLAVSVMEMIINLREFEVSS